MRHIRYLAVHSPLSRSHFSNHKNGFDNLQMSPGYYVMLLWFTAFEMGIHTMASRRWTFLLLFAYRAFSSCSSSEKCLSAMWIGRVCLLLSATLFFSLHLLFRTPRLGPPFEFDVSTYIYNKEIIGSRTKMPIQIEHKIVVLLEHYAVSWIRKSTKFGMWM